MKFLFIVQGEGRGHLTQALALEEILRKGGHEIVETLVGKSNSRQLPGFFNRNMKAPIRRFDSPNFQPSAANQRINLTRSVLYNILQLPSYLHSIQFIRQRIEETGVDAVINFYELLTGLTYALHRIEVPQICIGHQYLFLHSGFELPRHSRSSLRLLQYFTRLTSLGAIRKLALSFCEMPEDVRERITVVPPLLRREVLKLKPDSGDYIHGYMLNSGFASYVSRWHKDHPEVPLRFFWDRINEPKVKRIDDTLSFYQLDDVEFLRQMKGCKAYASTAGFESVCEAMFLGKPIMMVPAHIEQDCNALDAARNGAGIISHDFNLTELLEFAETYQPNIEFHQWVERAPQFILNQIEEAVQDYRVIGTAGLLALR